MSKLNESMESVPKRSLKNRSLINDTLADNVGLAINDDEAERREVEEQRRQQEIAESASKAKPRASFFQLLAEYHKWSPSERTAYHQKCLQMSTENKINTQNAFSLLLIDQMAQMMTEKSQMDNFQIAGCTLDASSKIYACRVDVVHKEALRIAHGFEKKSKKRIELGEDGNSSDGGGNADVSLVKAKKAKRNVLTDKNSLALIAEPDGDGYSVHQKDTIFEEFTTSAEASEPGNCHLLKSLKVQDSLCKLMLQSELPFARTTSQDFTTYCFPDVILSACDDFPKLTEFFICPTLRSHAQDDSLVVEQKTLEEGLQALTSLEENDEVFEMNYDEPEPYEDEDNEENVFISDKVSGLDMAENDFPNETMDTVAAPNACRNLAKPETIVDVANIVSVTALEYSFFNQKKINLLGGPERWKIGSFSTTQSSKNPTKRKRKEIAVVVYKRDASVPCSSNTTLTNRTMQMWSPEKLLMDRVILHEVTDFFKLWALPRAKLIKSLPKQTNKMEVDNESNESGDNCNFAMEFGNDASYNEDCNGIGGQDEFVSQQNTRNEDVFDNVITYKKELVTNETNVKPPAFKTVSGFLPYALKAKKIDMKQLKTAVFQLLTDDHQNKENTNENQPGYKFSQLYQHLPSKLEQKMEENLTPHLAIMALLHLANEKDLVIQDQKDLSDYRITFDNS